MQICLAFSQNRELLNSFQLSGLISVQISNDLTDYAKEKHYENIGHLKSCRICAKHANANPLQLFSDIPMLRLSLK